MDTDSWTVKNSQLIVSLAFWANISNTKSQVGKFWASTGFKITLIILQSDDSH